MTQHTDRGVCVTANPRAELRLGVGVKGSFTLRNTRRQKQADGAIGTDTLEPETEELKYEEHG